MSAHAHARAAASGDDGPAPVPGRPRVRVRGSGSLPGLVLFELGLTGMGYAEHTRSAIQIRTRSAIRIRTAPLTAVCKPSRRLDGCDGSTEQLQRFRPNRCNCWMGSDQTAPPGAL